MSDDDQQFCAELRQRTRVLLGIINHKCGRRARIVGGFENVADSRKAFEEVCTIASEYLGVEQTPSWPKFLHDCQHARGRETGGVMWIDGNTDISSVLRAR